MKRESFAGKVLDTLTRLAGEGNGEVTVDALHRDLIITSRKAHKQMLNALSDITLAGKVTRLRQGVYAPLQQQKTEIREVMWRVLRMRRRVTVDDLVEMAGASREYAWEWLRMLTDREVVRKINQGHHQPGVWQLINDPVKMPVDEEKAEKLRELRVKKKQQAMADLATAQELIGKACQALKNMEEDHG